MKPVNATPPLPYPSGSRDIYSLGAFDQDLTKALHAYLAELAFRLNGTLPKDGTEPMTGDLDMGGFDIVNTGTPFGTGDVVGPAGATDNNPAVFDGVTGKLIKEVTYATFKTSLALTKSDVGLSNVDNTSDATKFTNTALTGNPTAPTPSPGDNDTSIATTAFVTAADIAANPDASTTVKGHIEIATNTETGGQAGGTDTARAVTPDDLTFHSGRKETRIVALSAVTTNVLDLGTSWAFIELDWVIVPSVDGTVGFQVSYDNGSSWQTTAASHNSHVIFTNISGAPATVSGTPLSNPNYFGLAHVNTVEATSNAWGTRGQGIITKNVVATGFTSFDYYSSWFDNSSALISVKGLAWLQTSTNSVNAIRFTSPSGATLNGYVKMEIYYV